jgi:hypothetical protein
MATRSPRIFSSTAILILLFTGCLGCGKPSAYQAPVAKFRDASGVVIQATKVYLTEINKAERDQYIYKQAGTPAMIRLDQIEAVQVFSKEGIAARLKALDQLANYVDLLNQLANSGAPDKIKASANDLQTALTGLSGEVKNLTGEDDKQFKAAASKALPIIGDVLQAFAQQSIESALKKAINTGAAPVNDLIAAIETDVTTAYERKRTSYSARRVALVDQYNREFARGPSADPQKLKSYADEISAGEDQWEAFLAAQPNDGLEAMKKANDALVKFANTPRPKVTDFATFADAVDSFASTANRVGRGVQQLLKKP